jgi:probable rRNA maturation factor
MPIMQLARNEILTDVLIDHKSWKNHPNLSALIDIAIERTLIFTQNTHYKEISIYLTSNKIIKSLNNKYRGINKPTNILSFQSEEPHLGDLILSYEYINQELEVYKKEFDAHISHLIIHGLLHLLGINHDDDKDAKAMEEIEIKILKELGYNNPYEID